MMRNKNCVLLLAMAMVLMFAGDVLACACCAEKGARFITNREVTDYETDLLKQMTFAERATIYSDVSDNGGVVGLAKLIAAFETEFSLFEDDAFGTSAAFSESGWKISMSAKDGLSGMIELPVPEKLETFKVDLREGRRSGFGDPLLYKELRFTGPLKSASGLFSGASGTGKTFSLIFQGRGNVCDNTEDFTDWRLELNGPELKAAFFGVLSSGKEPETRDDQAMDFDDYSAEPQSGKASDINFGSHKDVRRFRTRLREALAEGPNFAGSYVFANWGCGTGCLMGAIIDSRTGDVFFPRAFAGINLAMAGMEEYEEPLEFRADSRLFVLQGYAADGPGNGIYHYEWTGKELKLLRFERREFEPGM